MRTMESFEEYVDPIHEVIDDLLLPTLFGQTEPLRDELRELVTSSPVQGDLSIPDLRSEATRQYTTSTSITSSHVESITTQSTLMVTSGQSMEELKTHHPSLRIAIFKIENGEYRRLPLT